MAWITGRNVRLRAWERDDVRLRWEADQTCDPTEALLRDWHEPPKSLQQRETEYDAQQADPDPATVALVIEAEGDVVGDINLFDIDQRNRLASVGISIWRPEHRDHGYGSDALHALLGWAFRQLNLHRVELSVAAQNERAIHVYEKLGFVVEGRRREVAFVDGCYSDDIVMSILRREFEARERCAAT
jgi:RimJ/RimL family protein N-acetyltransferase